MGLLAAASDRKQAAPEASAADCPKPTGPSRAAPLVGSGNRCCEQARLRLPRRERRGRVENANHVLGMGDVMGLVV